MKKKVIVVVVASLLIIGIGVCFGNYAIRREEAKQQVIQGSTEYLEKLEESSQSKEPSQSEELSTGYEDEIPETHGGEVVEYEFDQEEYDALKQLWDDAAE